MPLSSSSSLLSPVTLSGPATTGNNKNQGIVKSWQSSRILPVDRVATIPELLQQRQTYGMASPGHSLWKPSAGRSPSNRILAPYLASQVAWNPRRLQNTILVVGPGTPATVVTAAITRRHETNGSKASSSSSSSEVPPPTTESTNNNDQEADAESHEDDDVLMQDEKDDAEEEKEEAEEESSRDTGRRRIRARRIYYGDEEYEFLAGSMDNEDDDDDDDDDDDSVSLDENLLDDIMLDRRQADFVRLNQNCSVPQAPCYRPSMRHGGCINTAAWLDKGWRLSTINDMDPTVASARVHGILTDECPTQLVTSGDDHVVKFWDVRHAMGMTSPWPGGRATICPFSASQAHNAQDLEDEWHSMYESRPPSPISSSSGVSKGCQGTHNDDEGYPLPGSVQLLSTVHTGHQGNVFHVTPMEGKPGIVATSGADGFLRLTNVDSGISTVVVSPEYEDELSGILQLGMMRLRSAMCYSHHFMDHNVGLLCSELGLRRFDLRLSPREQSTQRLIGGNMFRSCKACAILTAPSTQASSSHAEVTDTAYVFVGGSSRLVALCDLRMTDDSQNRAVRLYAPSGLNASHQVSVSGLDLSRDRQELLVSYESDQIYTFPIFPNGRSQSTSIASQVEEELEVSAERQEEESGGAINFVRELSAYGAHLNRFTFLKNARYAGPRDEYICTGSDSGHAWIYEKGTGAVSSFWLADNSTCNGVVPHPSLPVFVTYGIDSTAKLWRSTVPIDHEVDDSAIGRRQHYRSQAYEMSSLTRDWEEVQSIMGNFSHPDGGLEELQQTQVFPDQIPSRKIWTRRGLMSRSWVLGLTSQGDSKLGNDLHNLHHTLKENFYACLRTLHEQDDAPVKSNLYNLKQRVAIIRLRHQADRLGLKWRLSVPWAMESQQTVSTECEKMKDAPEDHDVDIADLVPDHPSDWIPYDPEINSNKSDFCFCFNFIEHENFFSERYRFLAERNAIEPKIYLSSCIIENNSKESHATTDGFERISAADGNVSFEVDFSHCRATGSKEWSKEMQSLAKVMLLKTMNTLKDGGNRALKAGAYNIAARRYDKAIQYGALFFMKNELDSSCSPLLKTLIVTRLNMALLLLKPHFSELQVAEKQARQALNELDLFEEHAEDIGTEIRDEIVNLRAKALFRLGSALFEMGDYVPAMKAFEESIGCAGKLSNPNAKPDPLVVRRLAETKREQVKHCKRERKKFKQAFASKTSSPLAISPSSSSPTSTNVAQTSTPKNSPVATPTVVSDTKEAASEASMGDAEAESS